MMVPERLEVIARLGGKLSYELYGLISEVGPGGILAGPHTNISVCSILFLCSEI